MFTAWQEATTLRFRSAARLFLMPKRQDVSGIGGWFVAVQGNIARIAKRYQQLSQLRKFRGGAPNIWRLLQRLELPLDGPAYALDCFQCFGSQKATSALQAMDRAFSDDYSWHSGATCSSSVPQVLSQLPACVTVKCRPVS